MKQVYITPRELQEFETRIVELIREEFRRLRDDCPVLGLTSPSTRAPRPAPIPDVGPVINNLAMLPASEKEWLTIDEVAEALKVTPWTIRYWIKREEIEYRRWGKTIRLPAKVLVHGVKKDAVK